MYLETERLLLRNLRESDLDDFHVYHCDPEICKFQSYDAFTIEESRKFIEEQSRAEFGTPGEWVQVGIEWKETGKLVGDLALKPLKDEPRTVEIGVTLNPKYQGKGIAIEAFNKIFEYLFHETETHRVIGILDIENDGSRKLLENLNFRREAHFKKSYWDKGFNEWRDEYLYALLKEDWKKDLTTKKHEENTKEIR
jgi:RimJ/RimL family protein N-acetyltransferase